jgi:tetratricopeptide (TPR) repeat protein
VLDLAAAHRAFATSQVSTQVAMSSPATIKRLPMSAAPKCRHDGGMSSPENLPAGDAESRVCAWADRLEALGRVEDARRVLREALDRPHGDIAISLRLADLEKSAGDKSRAAELLRKVLGECPGHVEAARRLVQLLLTEGQLDEAARAIAGARPPEGLRELAGTICRLQGRHADAVEAFGPRTSLSRKGRWLRRRSWWRSGGPLRHRSHGTMSAPTAGQAIAEPDPPDELLESVAWAGRLSNQGRAEDARAVLSAAIATHGRHPRVVRAMAEVEDTAHMPRTALYLWWEAYQAAPNEVDIVCGLASQLSATKVEPSRTWRDQDALRVLAGFEDQRHPKIRTTRAEILDSMHVARSRIVAAYGTASGLPAEAGRHRRQLWWRSAGPLGQYWLELTDRIRGVREPVNRPMPRSGAESEAIARILDSIAEQEPAAALASLQEAWRQHGRQPSLLLAHAEVDASKNDNWRSLALAAEVVRSKPENIDAVCRLATAMHGLYGYAAGIQVLENLPSDMLEAVEIRLLLGYFHVSARNFARAVAAYGDPRDLNRWERRMRRRSVRKSPLRLRQHTTRGSSDIDLASFNPIDTELAHVLDHSWSLRDQPGSQRATLTAAMDGHGRLPLLLIQLAYAEFDVGNRHTSAALAAEAAGLAPLDDLIIEAAIWILWRSDYDAEALRAITDLPPGKLGSSPVLADTVGRVFEYWGLPAHVLQVFRGGLDAESTHLQRISWWRSGGPFRWVRSEIRAAGDKLMSGIPLPSLTTAALSALPLAEPIAAAARSNQLNYRLTEMRQTEYGPGAIAAWSKTINLAGVWGVLAALLVVELRYWPNAGTATAVGATAIAGFVGLLSAWVILRTLRAVTQLVVALGLGVGAAFLLQSGTQWIFVTGLALAVPAMTVVVARLTWSAMRLIRRVRLARWRRQSAEMGLLQNLLALLGILTEKQVHWGEYGRRRLMSRLERIAATLERDLPHTLRTGDSDSQSNIIARAHSAATAVRRMKQTIAMPDEVSWQALITELQGLATALACGDFTQWPPPAPAETMPVVVLPLWRRAMQAGRTTLVIFAPPLVAFFLPVVAPLNGPGLPWLRFAAIIWALLAALVALDPSIGDKAAKMREVWAFFREVTPSGNALSKSDSTGSADGVQAGALGPAVRPHDSLTARNRAQRRRTH